MNILAFKKYFISELSRNYPDTEIQSFFNILVKFQLKLSRIDVALKPSLEINTTNLEFFENAILNLKKHIPIQYVTGETEFYGLPFKVNQNVLIPRPETEELVDWIVKDYKNSTNIKILDIGTGSGCIAVSLAKNLPNAEVFAIDISKKALNIAKKNAKKNDVTIQFVEANILKETKLSEKFDIIVSNPPYVSESEKKQMQKNVLENEPHLALFVKDENPLLFYTKITELAKNNLATSGNLYFEINQYLGLETYALLKSNNFKKIQLKKDIFNADRMLKCSF